MSNIIQTQQLSKAYNKVFHVKDLDLKVKEGSKSSTTTSSGGLKFAL